MHTEIDFFGHLRFHPCKGGTRALLPKLLYGTLDLEVVNFKDVEVTKILAQIRGL